MKNFFQTKLWEIPNHYFVEARKVKADNILDELILNKNELR